MKFLAYLRSLAAKFFHRSQTQDELEEELRSHIEHRADDLERSGMDRAEAARRACIEFGGRQRFKEECREALGGNFIETLIQDVRFSLRVLRKSPGFTIVAVLTLALAIGPNSAPYIVLSYTYWQNHFQGDRGVVGRTVQVNKHPFTIVGVSPPGFNGTLLFFSPDFFMPMVNQEQVSGVSSLNARGNRTGVFCVIGHLKAGVTPAQAGA